MKRKAVFLAASVAELARFALIFFIAHDAGITAGNARGDIFRYAASAQLLFAVGFFFLWVDSRRYRQYAPLLLVGKAVCAALYLVPPLEGLAALRSGASMIDVSLLGPIGVFAVAAADALGLGALLYFLASERGGRDAGGASGDQAPGEIERVEA